MNMRTIESVNEIRKLKGDWQGESIGFVPTMGALHSGHMALVDWAKRENEHVLVSIFVNPTQFNDPQDLERYPRPLDHDLELLKNHGVDAVFLPRAKEIYTDDYKFSVVETQMSKVLCGPTRPGHFAGMLTVVMKLLSLAGATKAYFGEKDFQQLKLIEEMSRAFFLSTE